MQMKLLPWQLEHLPQGLIGNLGEQYTVATEVSGATKEKLEALLKNKKPLKTEEKRHKLYSKLCAVLGIEEDIRMIWSKGKGETNANYASRLASEKIKRIRKTLEPSAQAARIKREVDALLNGDKSDGTKYYIGPENYNKMINSLQSSLWHCTYYVVATIRDHNTLHPLDQIDLERVTNKLEDADNTAKVLKRVFGQIRGSGTADQLISLIKKTTKFYFCSITGAVGHKTVDPPSEVFIFGSFDWGDRNKYVGVNLNALRLAKYKNIIIPNLPAGQDPALCFVDERSHLVRGEDAEWNQARNAYVQSTSNDRWLCSSATPHPGLLQYSAQPLGVPASKLAVFKTRPHQIGFEVEFDTPYTKACCIRNSEGRPLTPPKVLDEFGWALCPDNSVKGGELKSPVIAFSGDKAEKHILEQIPREIQQYINEVNKNDSCGGHMNYSSTELNIGQIMTSIAAWGFVFALLYPERTNNRYCRFQAIDDPIHKYQWLRQKKSCIEVRIFPAHWDVQNIIWRAQLIAMMIEDAKKDHEKLYKADPCTTTTLLSNTRFSQAIARQYAVKNWKRFSQYEENKIRQHIIGANGLTKIQGVAKGELFKSNVYAALGLQESDLQPIK